MAKRPELQNPEPKTPARKPGTEIAESDLDKVSGGVSSKVTPTTPATPPGVPIPYPNISST